tara:strand:- start:961 stop:1251 length:291 start_codon:yes stop_codon:yes gene_type:complete
MKDFFNDIKKQIIAGVGIVITAISGIVVTQFKDAIGIKEDKKETKTEKVVQQPSQPNITINIPQQEVKRDTVVKVVKVKSKPKKTETEKRKEELDW